MTIEYMHMRRIRSYFLRLLPGQKNEDWQKGRAVPPFVTVLLILNVLLDLQYEDWLKARAGLAAGQAPKLASSGTGGSYFIADARGKNVAVFKPEDEEPMAINNPKGHCGEGKEGYR